MTFECTNVLDSQAVTHLEDVFKSFHCHLDDLHLIDIQQITEGLDAASIHQIPAVEVRKLNRCNPLLMPVASS